MRPVDLLPDYFDPKPDKIVVSRFSGARKIHGRGGANVLPLRPSHCTDAQEERAKHWAGIWTRFWSGK